MTGCGVSGPSARALFVEDTRAGREHHASRSAMQLGMAAITVRTFIVTNQTPARRRFLLACAAAAAGSAAWGKPAAPVVEVWKSPSCGCCKDWVRHLEARGFTVRTHDDGNAAARERLGIPVRYGSCHTANVAGYAIEGHVPAREITRLLKERPVAVGLAAPGMPVGSPGMDGPAYHGRHDPYDVLLVRKDGSSSVYQAYR